VATAVGLLPTATAASVAAGSVVADCPFSWHAAKSINNRQVVNRYLIFIGHQFTRDENLWADAKTKKSV
jgi:hypothetical protein